MADCFIWTLRPALKRRAMPSTMVSFILNGNQSSKNLTRLQQDLIQGFRQGFLNQYKSWMTIENVFEKSPMLGQHSLKAFLGEMFSKESLSKSDANILKAILFKNSGSESRWKQSFYVQFVIGRLFKSELKSSSQYGQKILQKIRSFTAVLSTNEKEQFYSELPLLGSYKLFHGFLGLVQHHINTCSSDPLVIQCTPDDRSCYPLICINGGPLKI